LHRPEEFKAVLRRGRGVRQRTGQWFAVAAIENELGRSRLGIIVARRGVPRAVARNAHKRMIRETFRQLQQSLPALDVVVRVVREASDARARQSAREELVALLAAISK
jgi:ribonuclease P protein component